jgi:hypothetical protein
MHSGHMLREGTWPDHVRVNMGLANVHVTQIVLRQELVEGALGGAHRHMP